MPNDDVKKVRESIAVTGSTETTDTTTTTDGGGNEPEPQKTNATGVESTAETKDTTETIETTETGTETGTEENNDDVTTAGEITEQDRFQRRINRETAKRKRAEEEAAALKAKLQELESADGTKVLTEADVEAKAKDIAATTLAEQQFTDMCNKLAESAGSIDKEFKKKVNTMAEEIGPLPRHLVQILGELDNGGEVLSHLTNNVDLAEDIYKLSAPRMAVKLARIGDELEAKRKAAKAKPVSKVPEPPKPVGSNTRTGEVVLHDKMTDADWIKAREAQLAEKRKNGQVRYI